jgi:hypothetical protein
MPTYADLLTSLERLAEENPPKIAELRRHIERMRAIGFGSNQPVDPEVWRHHETRFIPEIRGLIEPLPFPWENPDPAIRRAFREERRRLREGCPA